MYEKYAAKQREIVAKLLEEQLNYTDFNSGRELKINMGAEKPQTNADRIRAMSDEELAAFIDEPSLCKGKGLGECMNRDCKVCVLEWLQQPAEGE